MTDGIPGESAITRPSIGVLVDPGKMVAARRSAMLERLELAALSGVSRDEIAKLENGERKRPKITTLRKLITAYNKGRADRGKSPIDVEDLQAAGEIFFPTGREPRDLLTEDDPGENLTAAAG